MFHVHIFYCLLFKFNLECKQTDFYFILFATLLGILNIYKLTFFLPMTYPLFKAEFPFVIFSASREISGIITHENIQLMFLSIQLKHYTLFFMQLSLFPVQYLSLLKLLELNFEIKAILRQNGVSKRLCH